MSGLSWLQQTANRVRSHARTANAANAYADANVAANATAPVAPRGLFRRTSARDRSRWAQRALAWPLTTWLEGAVWLGVLVTLAVSYYGSYDNLVIVLMAVGYAFAPAHVVPLGLDAPLSVSVIGQFLLARWKSPPVRRWRLWAVTLITAPLSLAGNALRGAVVFDRNGNPYLDLQLLDLHRPEVWIRLVAAMVPSIGVILAVAVTELVLREHARLEELREAMAPAEAEPVERSEVGERAPAPTRPAARLVDPRVLRVVRAGGDWRAVGKAAGLGEHAAKRALTAARKQILAESRPDANAEPAGEDVASPPPPPFVLAGAAPAELEA